MDWDFAIDKHREALRRILALLVAMAGLGGAPLSFSPCGTRCRGEAETDVGCCEVRRPVVLPRRLHRSILRLLRPAESAARRLIVVAARGLVVPPPPLRALPPKPSLLPRGSAGTGIVSTGIPIHRLGLANVAPPSPRLRNPFRPLPLVDPLRGLPRRPARPRGPIRGAIRSVPRIGVPGEMASAARLPSPGDCVDATRLRLRLAAIASVLDDLPRHALRMARWRAARAAAGAQSKEVAAAGAQSKEVAAAGAQSKEVAAAGAQSKRIEARHAAGRTGRLRPIRPGRPPGWRRRPTHEVHSVLDDLHGLAVWALERPDTS